MVAADPAKEDERIEAVESMAMEAVAKDFSSRSCGKTSEKGSGRNVFSSRIPKAVQLASRLLTRSIQL